MKLDYSSTALVMIDVQNDFCPAYTAPDGVQYPEGALAVKNGGEVVSPLNWASSVFARKGGRVIATMDWHPEGHVSFASAHSGAKIGDVIKTQSEAAQTLWPNHCVQGSKGAAFNALLDLKPVNLIIRKGWRKELDSYSAFYENDRKTATGLDGWLRSLNITTLVFGGLATDYCVFYSALDSVNLKFHTVLLEDAVRAVGYPAGSEEKALAALHKLGVEFTTSKELV
jgi:nicotinamidase/pyrazinamidase